MQMNQYRTLHNCEFLVGGYRRLSLNKNSLFNCMCIKIPYYKTTLNKNLKNNKTTLKIINHRILLM